ncbi:MAG: hypothetical protein HPY59_08320 [Anaerolineae bacterium]|nr:hypothetical protein [Anaerolineae bacterium]
MVVNDFPNPVAVQVSEDNTTITLRTCSLQVKIARSSWQIFIYQAGDAEPGKEVFCSLGLKMPIAPPTQLVKFKATSRPLVRKWHRHLAGSTCTLRSGLGFGLSGFIFWGHDIGGFLAI